MRTRVQSHGTQSGIVAAAHGEIARSGLPVRLPTPSPTPPMPLETVSIVLLASPDGFFMPGGMARMSEQPC